jgi:RNA 2',3'-cyclic 3'-phosphodiesterase
MREGRAEGRREAPRGVRSFVAVLLPEAVRARVDAMAAPLRALGAPVSWVRAENLHVTLRFLGALDEAMLASVREALAEAAAATAPFTLTLGGFGGFPTPRAPRVVWVGLLAGADALGALHARVEQALARRGLPPEERAFHGHVTLGRAREPRGAAGLVEALAVAPEPLGEVAVDAVHLMRSDLHPTGARYDVLAREGLGGAASASRV